MLTNCCTRALVEWEREQAILLEPEIKHQHSQYKNQEKYIETQRSKAAKENDIIVQRRLFQEIANLEAALCEPPPLPVLFATDATPESLAISAYEQGGRFAMFSDEGGLLETLAGLYSHGHTNIDILLKGIDGGAVRIRRKDRNFQLNPYLTIVLTVQPAIIRAMGDKRAYSGNGALERFLYVLPKSRLGYRTHEKASVPQSLQQFYNNSVKALLETFAQSKTLDDVSKTLTLSPKAYQAWREFQNKIEVELRPEGKLTLCQGWGGKISGIALRLAGLIHIADNDYTNLVIDTDTILRALQLATCLTHHAIAAYGLLGIDEASEDAKEVFRWISMRKLSYFKKSELVLAMRHKKCGKSERLSKALTLLIERNLISSARKLRTRKPTTVYYIHPDILANDAK